MEEFVSSRNVLLFTLALLLVLLVAAPPLLPQNITAGDITGTVTDPSGAVVPGATVTLKSTDQGFTKTAKTGGNGFYRFALLPPGSYTLTFSGPNLQSTERTVNVTVGQATTVDVKLALARAEETVTVVAEGGVLQTEQPSVSTSFSSQQIALAPNPGNDLSYVAQTAPGAVMNTQGGLGNFSAFGLPANANNFNYNGMLDNDPFLNLNNTGATNIQLGLNDVKEVTVVNNGYGGQYGGLAGSTVNYVSKSGTNAFHGNAIYWWNGRIMNANNFFNNQSDQPRAFVNDNQWAASFGGPIKKDSTFFFVDTEGLRVIVPVVRNINVPSPQFEQATLANLAASGQAAQVPFYQRMFSLWNNAPGASSAQNILRNGGCQDFLTSASNTAGFGASLPCALRFTSTVGSLTHEWLLTGRVDHNIGPNDKMFVRYRMDRGVQATYIDPISSVFNLTSFQPQYEGQFNETHTFGTNKVNSFILAGSYYRAIFDNPDPAKALATMPFEVQLVGGAFRDLGRDFAFPSPTPQGRNVTQYQIIDDFSWTRGSHTLKFGVNFHRNLISNYDIGGFSFIKGVVGPNNTESLTSFFNGVVDSYQQGFPIRTAVPNSLYGLGLYVQDELRATSNLKLTLTLRADRYSNVSCGVSNCLSRLVSDFNKISHNPNQPYNQVIQTGFNEVFRNLDGIVWEPRIGFAWTPFGSASNTVIRGGWGIFASGPAPHLVDNLMTQVPQNPVFLVTSGSVSPDVPSFAGNAAVASNAAFRNGFANGGTLASLTDQVAAAGGVFSVPTFNNVPTSFPIPRFYEWNLEVQHAFGEKTSLSLNYVGNHGSHLMIQNPAVNAFDPGGFGGLPLPTTVVTPGGTTITGGPDPRFATVTEVGTGAVSNYHGLTASFLRRFSNFQFQANYTWSHALDMSSNAGDPNVFFNFNTNSSIVFPQDPNNIRKYNYGNADYDVRHYFSANFVYTTPFKFSNGFLNQLLGGWTIGSTWFARSGLPFTVIDGDATGILTAQNYGATVFANQNAPGPFGCSRSAARPESPCAGLVDNFSAVTTNFGQQRRNQVRGPYFFNTDLNLLKSFKLGSREGTTLAVGAVFYNLLNHPNFDQPVGDVAAGNFGQILLTANAPTSIYGSFLGGDASPRNIQLTARFTF
jgi:hypothetical protein